MMFFLYFIKIFVIFENIIDAASWDDPRLPDIIITISHGVHHSIVDIQFGIANIKNSFDLDITSNAGNLQCSLWTSSS